MKALSINVRKVLFLALFLFERDFAKQELKIFASETYLQGWQHNLGKWYTPACQ